jgi:hypothetical protein
MEKNLLLATDLHTEKIRIMLNYTHRILINKTIIVNNLSY